VALSQVKKVLILTTLLTGAIAAAAGSVVYLATRPVQIDWQQDPNKVELYEANRKISLFDEAQSTRRKGFIRLSEVEINSFLQNRFKMVSAADTNALLELKKSAVLLTGTNIQFVAWLEKPVFGYRIPFVWQRSIIPVRENNKWTFAVQEMKIGQLEIPRRFWSQVEAFVGSIDAAFEEKRDWLAQVPSITLSKNELSHFPEVRLYTFLPDKNHR
jgi:hypothetical protein